MEFKTLLCIISFLNLQIICSSSELNGNKPNVLKFRYVLQYYNKYIKSPPPRVVMISTREVFNFNARKFEPEGLIVLRCPSHIDIGGTKRYCVGEKEKVKMMVLIVDTKKFVKAETYNEVKCLCK